MTIDELKFLRLEVDAQRKHNDDRYMSTSTEDGLLVLIGVLADDSRRHVKQIHPLVETDRDNPRIEVELIEAQ